MWNAFGFCLLLGLGFVIFSPPIGFVFFFIAAILFVMAIISSGFKISGSAKQASESPANTNVNPTANNQAGTKDARYSENSDDLRGQDIKLLGAARRLEHAKGLLSELERKGKRGGIIDLALNEQYRDLLIRALDTPGRETFQQAYDRLACLKLDEEGQIGKSKPEQAAGKVPLSHGDINSQPSLAPSDLQSADAGEHKKLDDKEENLRNRLRSLKDYYEEGLITEDEYTTKKTAILDDL